MNDATGHAEPVGVFARAHFGDEVPGGLCAAGVVPEQGISDDAAIGIQHDHAVLLSADRDRRHVVEAAGVGERELEGIPPGGRRHLGAGRMRRAALAHDRAGVGIRDDDLAALGR